MNVNDAFPSKYISSNDVGTKNIPVVIDRITMEDVGHNSRGQMETKPVIYFQGAKKGLVLNKTNAMDLAFYYGEEMDDWWGKPVTLYTVQTTDLQGKPVRGIRTRIEQHPSVGAQQPAQEIAPPPGSSVPSPPPAVSQPVPASQFTPTATPATPPPIEGLDDEIPF